MPFDKRETLPVQPRAQGALRVSAKAGPGGGRLEALRAQGSLRALFPRGARGVEVCLVNTAGGLTGGDRVAVEATAGAGATITLSTQAAERAYRAEPGSEARLDVRLAAGPGARLSWLPQETILYDGAALARRLHVDLAGDARLLLVESLVFGRAAMGERLRELRFRDRIEIRRDGRLAWLDAVRLEGCAAELLARPGVAAGAGAMAALVYAGPDAAAQLGPLRAAFGASGGASLVEDGLLAARVLAPESHALRRALLPALDRLTGDSLPKAWRL
ncbi:urease accessory protein UreD [Rhodosalinus sp. K401]|uniref:urease accessory protein UreD n=1 Tax=Rhodosalinus sp. K401 TaxID=3239195 RepID=UPI0035257A72